VPEDTHVIKRIVVGTDGSNHAQHAVQFAADLAAQLRAEVTLVCAIPPYPALAAAAAGTVGYLPPEQLEEDRAVLRARVEGEYAKPLTTAGVIWRCRIEDGVPPEVVANVAREISADFVVVGTRSLHAVGELFLGSTSHALTHHSPIPVLVVPMGEHTAAQPTTEQRVPAAV